MMPTISEIPAFRCGNSTVNQCATDCKPVFYSEPGTSIVTEWSLVCNRRILLTLPDSLFMVGFVLGALIGGPLTDIFGRRKNCIANSFGMALSMAFALLPGGVNVFSTMRLFQGYFSARFRIYLLLIKSLCLFESLAQPNALGACYNAIYCSFIEFIPRHLRAPILPIVDSCSGFASIFVGVAGVLFKKWRHTIWFYTANMTLRFEALRLKI